MTDPDRWAPHPDAQAVAGCLLLLVIVVVLGLVLTGLTVLLSAAEHLR